YQSTSGGPPPAGGGNAPPGQDDAWNRNEGRITDAYIAVREAQNVRVVAINDGATVWSASSETPVVGIELLGSALLVAADHLRSFKVANQAQLWDYNARGGRVAVTSSGSSVFVAGDEAMSLVDASGRPLWSLPYPDYLLNAAPDWVGVAGDLGYV